MQLIITDARFRSRTIQLSGLRLTLAVLLASVCLMLLSAGLYHWVFLKGAREGWPVISTLVRVVVRDEEAQRERFIRENIDLMAKRLGEMQAKMLQLESLGERVSGLAGINPAEIKTKPGQGGLLLPGRSLNMQELQEALADLVGLHRTYVGSVERSERNVSLDNIEKLAVALKVDVSHLLAESLS